MEFDAMIKSDIKQQCLNPVQESNQHHLGGVIYSNLTNMTSVTLFTLRLQM